MSKKNLTNNLGYLGNEYQERLVKCLIEDQQFFKRLNYVIDQNMFTEEPLRRIVGTMKDLYNNRGTVPSYMELEIVIKASVANVHSENICVETLIKIRDMETLSIDIIENEAEKFFRQQNLVKAINQANEIVKRGNAGEYVKIEDIFKKALEVNLKVDVGDRLFENINGDLSDTYRQTISTGCPELDHALFGGLGKGELGVIIAPMNVGKSSVVTGFAAAAATTKTDYNNNKGFKVMHLFFEDKEEAIKRKYYAWYTGIDANDLSLPEVKPIAIKLLNEDKDVRRMLKENIMFKRLPSGEVTASAIKHRIQQAIAFGFKPDLVIIDYFECLKGEKGDGVNDSEWSREGITMRKLESICNEMEIGIWVPVQGTKGSIGQEVLTLAHAGGSVTKTQIGHVIITLARTEEQRNQNRMTLSIAKLRATKVRRTRFPNIRFDHGTCKFDMSDLVDEDSVNVIDTGQMTAQQLAARIKRENM